MLKEKHSLEEQEEKLRQQKEELQLKADIAASMAKVNVLRTSGSGVRSAASHRSDGMESYFKKKGKAVEALNPLSAKVAKLRQDVILHKIDCSS